VRGARRLALFTALLGPLVVAAVLLASDGGEDEIAQPPATPGAHDQRASKARGLRALAAERIARAQIRHEGEAARREDPHGEPGPAPMVLQLYRHTGAEAEPTARSFFAAFSLYEIGRLDEAVRRELRASATRAFADRLLSAPPRLPSGLSMPESAYLGRLEFVPGKPDASGRRLISGEFVGGVRRGGGAETIAVEVRLAAGGWRVSGLGR
jgi:hypothetical protein